MEKSILHYKEKTWWRRNSDSQHKCQKRWNSVYEGWKKGVEKQFQYYVRAGEIVLMKGEKKELKNNFNMMS